MYVNTNFTVSIFSYAKVDLQSEDFFRHIIFSQAGPNSSSFGLHLVSHPFIVDNQIPASLQGRHHDLSQSDLSLSSSEDSTNDQEQDLAQTSYIRRIRPAPIIELRRLRPESGASEVSLAHVEPLLPALTLIQGENALQIQTTQLLFYLLNHVWLQPSSRFPDSDAAPICVTFDVVATSAQSGFVQSFPRTQPFRTFNMEFWRDTKGYDPVAVDQFIRTAAGAYTAAYICGVHARNAPDICVRDGDAVFLAAFDGLFVSAPAWRVQVRKDLRATLRALSVWDTFRTCCLRAFAVARETFHDVFPVVAPLYEMCADTSKEAVLKFWAGKTCLNMVDQDAETCDAMFRRWLGN